MFKKGLVLGALAIVVAAAALAFSAFDRSDRAQADPTTPTGKHFTLNLIAGPEKNMNGNLTGGSVIFMPLECQQKGNSPNSPDPSTCADNLDVKVDCTIALQMGDYQVIDKNCTDGHAAFQLPDPCAADNTPGTTTCSGSSYSVWIALAGTPGGGMKMRTCLVDGGVTFCSLENVIRFRTTGKPGWSDVSKCLLSVWVDVNGDTVPERTFIFDPDFDSYLWQYDNFGNRLAKVRFYPVPSTFTGAGVNC